MHPCSLLILRRRRRDCQVEDWKRGDPPHKTICGKPLAEAAQQLPQSQASGQEPRFPPASPGFVRSPALLYTLKALEENPWIDYLLVTPSHESGDHAIQVSQSDPKGQLFFRFCLQRAVTTGDPDSVHMMYKALKSSAEQPGGIGVAALRRQLKNEYGVDVKD